MGQNGGKSSGSERGEKEWIERRSSWKFGEEPLKGSVVRYRETQERGLTAIKEGGCELTEVRTVEKEEHVGRICCRLTFRSPLDQEVGSVLQRLAGERSIVCAHLRKESHSHTPQNHLWTIRGSRARIILCRTLM